MITVGMIIEHDVQFWFLIFFFKSVKRTISWFLSSNTTNRRTAWNINFHCGTRFGIEGKERLIFGTKSHSLSTPTRWNGQRGWTSCGSRRPRRRSKKWTRCSTATGASCSTCCRRTWPRISSTTRRRRATTWSSTTSRTRASASSSPPSPTFTSSTWSSTATIRSSSCFHQPLFQWQRPPHPLIRPSNSIRAALHISVLLGRIRVNQFELKATLNALAL